jgi:formylglycine-generating enzyme required for sulfatase activity
MTAARTWTKVVLGAFVLYETVLPAAAQNPSAAPSRGVDIPSAGAHGPASYGRRHAVVIGVNDYDDPAFPDLSHAVTDARSVARKLVEGFGFEEDRVLLILNEDATQDGVEEVLQNWACDENHDLLAQPDEQPCQEITLDPFFLSKVEMTQGQWLRIMRSRPSYFDEQDPLIESAAALHPVEQVSWESSSEALMRLGLVLPTEAQWEYAARAGTTTPWWTGADKESLAGAANIADSNYVFGFVDVRGEEWLDDGFEVHAPVGSLRPNALGLHDLAGNVWEWCQDWYGEYENKVREGDGLRLIGERDERRDRVLRGGSFDFTVSDARSAARYSDTPEFRYHNVGLRAARALD